MLLLNGKVQYFEGATNDQIAKNLIYNQLHFLGINLTYRKEDSIPIDATITTYLEYLFLKFADKNIFNFY